MNALLTSLERVSPTEIVIKRLFHAPPAIVFRAWTEPELVKRWWAPLSCGMRVAECTAELVAGGAYRYVLARGDERFAFFGKYVEISPSQRLVYTQSFEPVIGHPLPGEARITISFVAQGGSTAFESREVYPSKEVLDGVLASGMEEGMRETFEQLEALLAT